MTEFIVNIKKNSKLQTDIAVSVTKFSNDFYHWETGQKAVFRRRFHEEVLEFLVEAYD